MSDYALGSTFDHKFTSRNTSNAPTTLTSGAVAVYEDDSDTEITDGITLSADFDSITGYNNLRIVATSGNGYSAGKSYSAVLTAGTVGGTSVAGETILNFTIERSDVNVIEINGKRTDGTPAVADRPQLFLQQLDLHCSIDGEGALQINNDHATGVGVLSSGYYDVLLAGSGTIVDNNSGGPVAVDLSHIKGTALTETSGGYLAAAFVKLFDVESPALVASDVMRGTDGAASASALSTVDGLVDTLIARLTAARAGYLDNLGVGGNVASQADVQNITQACRVRVGIPPQMERPDSGQTTYRVYVYVYNEQHQAEDLDSNPTITVENHESTDRSTNLGTPQKPGGTTGVYYADYLVESTHAVEGLVFKVSVTEGAVTTVYPASSVVVDTTAVDFTADDRTKLTAILEDTGTTLPASLAAHDGKLDTVDGIVDSILVDTNELQTNQGNWATATGFSTHDAADVKTAIEVAGSSIASILADTNQLQKLAEADWAVDTSVTPFALVALEKDTGGIGVGTELLRQTLKDVNGDDITSTTTVIGQVGL